MNPEDNNFSAPTNTTAPDVPNTAPQLEKPQTAPVLGAQQPISDVPPVNQPGITDSISPDSVVTPLPAQPIAPIETPALAEEVYPAPPMPAANPVQQNTKNPAETMAIVGLILAIFLAPVGLIVSIIARSKSKKAGHSSGLALAGIITSIVFMLPILAVLIFTTFAGVQERAKVCSQEGSGIRTLENGGAITCK